MVSDITQETPVVAIMKATYGTAEAQIREALRLLGYEPQRKQILLKPSVFSPTRWLPLGGVPRAANTDTRFLEALLRIFAGYEVVIAESGAATYDTDAALEETGVAPLARKYGAQVLNLDHAERVEVPWRYGTLRLPTVLQTHEYINVPKLKTHVLMGVTLGCKNQKGLLSGEDKIRFHQKLDLPEAISALTDAVQPALTIVDGIVGLDRGGPTVGRAHRADLIVAGRDVRAVDVACCDLISVPLERVKYLDRVPYRSVGRSVDEARVRFEPSTEIVVAQAHLHGTYGACGRCMMSLQDGMAAFWRSPYHLLRGTWSVVLNRTDILVGPGFRELPQGHGRVVCYGDCTRDLAVKNGLQWVPGCPPSVQEHLKVY